MACIQIKWHSPTPSSPSFLAWRWLRCWRKKQRSHSQCLPSGALDFVQYPSPLEDHSKAPVSSLGHSSHHVETTPTANMSFPNIVADPVGRCKKCVCDRKRPRLHVPMLKHTTNSLCMQHFFARFHKILCLLK